MDLITNYVKEQLSSTAASFVFSISSTPFLLVNHILQASFFSMAVTCFIAFLLRLANFAYAQSISRFKLIQIIAIALFYMVKIWQAYNWLLSLFTMFSCAIVSMYIYDCNQNIATALNPIKISVFRDFKFLIIVLVAIGSNFWLVILIKQSNPKYEYYGYFAILQIVAFIVLLARTKNIGKSVFHVMMMSFIVILRIYITNLIREHPIATADLPFSSIPFLLLALDAQKKERDQTKYNLYKNLFFSAISFFVYSLLNWPGFPLQLMYGAIILVFTILGK